MSLKATLFAFVLLMIVAKVAGRMYGTLGGGVRGAVAVVLVCGAAFMLYIVATIVLSWLWAGIDRLRGHS